MFIFVFLTIHSFIFLFIHHFLIISYVPGMEKVLNTKTTLHSEEVTLPESHRLPRGKVTPAHLPSQHLTVPRY